MIRLALIREGQPVTDFPKGSFDRFGQQTGYLSSWRKQALDEAGKTELESEVVSRQQSLESTGTNRFVGNGKTVVIPTAERSWFPWP